jgi:protein-histidine pros-kinase
MKLLKFNLVFIPILVLCFGAIGYLTQQALMESARQQVEQNARIIMEAALSSRTYTTKQVAPLLLQKNFKLQTAVAELRKTIEEVPKSVDQNVPSDLRVSVKRGFVLGQQHALSALEEFLNSIKGKSDELLDTEFHPQSVPAFAATEIFGYLREKFPNYFYKEATLNPTNPRDRATDWETDIVNQFSGDKEHSEISAARDTPNGISVFLARPIKVNNVSCLECHSTAEKAPVEMIKLYGTANGFGWKLDDIIGAQIVSVPLSVPLQAAEVAFRSLLWWFIGAFLIILVAANVMVLVLVRVKTR